MEGDALRGGLRTAFERIQKELYTCQPDAEKTARLRDASVAELSEAERLEKRVVHLQDGFEFLFMLFEEHLKSAQQDGRRLKALERRLELDEQGIRSAQGIRDKRLDGSEQSIASLRGRVRALEGDVTILQRAGVRRKPTA